MVERIRDSLTAKVFLWIFGLLVVCSLVIYGCVMYFLPQSYAATVRANATDKLLRLTEELSQANVDNIASAVEQFSLENRLVIEVGNGTDTQIYGILDDQVTQWDSNFAFSTGVSTSDSNSLYTLRLVAWASAEQELTSAFWKLLPTLLTLILFISALGAFLCSKVLVKPILEISQISQRIADLDLTLDCSMDRTDEIGILAGSLDTMSRKLGQALLDLESANIQLQEDMSHIAALSEQRRDFFAAASHELKTPITILKGQIESMILGIGSYKDTRKVLPDTLKEVENMERLVKEILTISKIEMDGLSGRSELFSLSASLEKVVELLHPLAEEKGTTIQKNIAPGIMIHGNPSLLEKALHNIVSNAIRHSPERAVVSVTLQSGLLAVCNSGITIPEDDIEALFTPFYRVEKSRNKATGGSGLGLYLVKTILQLHKLSYQLANRGEGVCFSIKLNQN